MIADLKPYPVMNDSGVPWLGKVPKQWVQRPGRACFREKKDLNLGMQEETVLSLSYGQLVIKPPEKLHGLVPASFETYQVINPGDIVVRPTDLQNDWNSLRFGLSTHTGIITSAYMCLQTAGALTKEYGFLLMHAYDLKKVFYGLGSGLRQNLDWRDFKYLPCLVPPLAEQDAIVRFLNHVDRRLTQFIRNKRRMIALLEEQRQAIICEALTHGEDPSVPLRPSGVSWLGAVPAHWAVGRLKFCLIHNDGGVWGTAASEDGTIVLRSTEQTVDGHWRIDAPARRVLSEHERKSALLRDGDLLVTKSSGSPAHIGKTSIVDSDIEAMECCFSNFTQRLRLTTDTAPRFAWYVLNSLLAREQFRFQTNSTTGLGNLNSSVIGGVWVAWPPRAEQEALVSHLVERLVPSDSAIDRTRREIGLIREYRARLVADVVTGKVDVRDAAARLPDVLLESEPLVDSLDGLAGDDSLDSLEESEEVVEEALA